MASDCPCILVGRGTLVNTLDKVVGIRHTHHIAEPPYRLFFSMKLYHKFKIAILFIVIIVKDLAKLPSENL